jgi:GNAT superfamily N-acetyltransferase
MSVTVREATPDDRLGVRRVLDAAMLEVREDLPERIEAGDVLVAEEVRDESETEDGSETEGDHLVLGALVLLPREWGDRSDSEGGANAHIHAVAVRRARRGRGVGAALVRTAAERHDRLTAAFDPDVRPFYESLGFVIAEREDGRLWGSLE